MATAKPSPANHGWRVLGVVIATLALVGCGADADTAGASFDDGWLGGADTGSSDGQGLQDGGGSDASIPEQEEELELNLPTASERYLFVASRSTNTVARIDSLTLAVTPIRVGREPTVIRTTQTGDVAVVLNQGADTVSVIHARPEGDRVDTVDIVPGCNALVVAPSGTHAVAWYDNRSAHPGDRIGSLQDVSLIELAAGVSFEISVGFNIRGVQFDDAGGRGFVVTDSGVTVMELGDISGDIALPEVPLGDDPLVSAIDREVRVGSAGHFAVVRAASSSSLRILDLVDDGAVTVDLPGVPTDIDLLAGDAVVVASLRDQGQVAVVDLAAAVRGEGGLELLDVAGVSPGVLSLSEDDAVALVYTTATDERRFAVLDLLRGAVVRVVGVQKGIRLVAAAPVLDRAVVLHTSEAGDTVAGEPIEDVIAHSEGLSVVDLSTGYVKLMLLPVEPTQFVFASGGTDLFVMLADEARDVRRIEWINLDTFARQSIALDAQPEGIGVVPATGRIWVSQADPQGRITFIDPVDGSVQHVTGFQLNTFIE